MAHLTTRGAVRGMLAEELNGLIGEQSEHDLPPELAGLATGSDREVVETSRRLDKSVPTRAAPDARSTILGMPQQIRDLFAKALRRMKELPPDPRETLHAMPLASSSTPLPKHKPRKRW